MAQDLGSPTIDEVTEVKDLWLDAREFFRPHTDRVHRGIRFTIQNRHYKDEDVDDLDKRRAKPKNQSLMNQCRHVAARIVQALEHFEVNGTDPSDAYAAARWKARINLWAYNPATCLRDVKGNMAAGAVAGGAWGVYYRYSPFAGVVLDHLDPAMQTWHTGFQAPYHPINPWMTIEQHLTPAEIKAMGQPTILTDGTVIPGWENVDDVPTDNGLPDTGSGHSADGRITWGNRVSDSGTTKVGFVTVLFHYRRYDYGFEEIPQLDQQMKCGGCDWNSQTQGEYGAPLPQEMPCPDCGATATNTQVQTGTAWQAKWPMGQHMVIAAPFANRKFYAGPWWYKSTTSLFPADQLKLSYAPTEPYPLGETDLHKPQVLILDAIARLAYEQMQRSRGLIVAPVDGLEDSFGEPFDFTDEKDIAWYTGTMGKDSVGYFQPPGMPPAVPALMSIIQGGIETTKGTGDLSLTPDQSKDIAVGTVETLVRTGEVPVDDKIGAAQAMWGRVLTVFTEIAKSTDPPTMDLTLMGPMGQMQSQQVAMADQPGVHITVTAEPSVSKERLDNVQKVLSMGLLQLPPGPRNVIARWAGISDSMMNDLTMAEQQAGVTPGQPGGPGGPPGSNPGQQGGPPPDQQQVPSPNGTDIEALLHSLGMMKNGGGPPPQQMAGAMSPGAVPG